MRRLRRVDPFAAFLIVGGGVASVVGLWALLAVILVAVGWLILP